MGFPSGAAAIVGVYTTEQAKDIDRSAVSLQIEAVKGALEDAGLTFKDVDGIIPMDMTPYGPAQSGHMFWAEQLGERPITFMGTGLASGALAKAAVAIDAGMANVVVYVWAKAGWNTGPKGQRAGTEAPRVDQWSFQIHGGYMTPLYALWAQRYMHEFGVSSADLAEVAVTHRYHASLKPDSVMGSRGEISVDDVLASRFIAEPLHLLDCSIDNDGGYAIVVASKEIARNCKRSPVWILGGAEASYTDFYATFTDPWFPEEGNAARKSADLAFSMAGVEREDIDVGGLYDCFTVTMFRNLEELGFCKIGEGADYFKEGHTRLGGAMPCNTDGGLLSNSHNGFPMGMHTIEVARQLRGECGPRQVPDANLGISFGQGYAVHGHTGTLIMGVD